MSTELLKDQLELSWKNEMAVNDNLAQEEFDHSNDDISYCEMNDINDTANEQLLETKNQLFQCEKDFKIFEDESNRKMKLIQEDIERYQQERDEEAVKYDTLHQEHIELKLNFDNQSNQCKSLRLELNSEIELRQELQVQFDLLKSQRETHTIAYEESKYIVETKHLTAQVADLNKELSELRNKNSILRDENYEFKTRNEHYVMKNGELNFELEEMIKHKGDLSSQNVEMSDDLRVTLKKSIGLQEEVDHLSSSYELLSNEYDDKVELCDELLNEQKSMEVVHDNLKMELDEANSELNGLKDELHLTKQLANELQSNKEEWLSNEEKLFYQEMHDAEEKIAHLTKSYSDSVEAMDSQRMNFELKLNEKSEQIQEFQTIIDTQRVEYDRSIDLHQKDKDSSLKAVHELEQELQECKSTIQHYDDIERTNRNEFIKEISRLKAKSIEDCNRILITLTGLQQVIRQICTESMANRDSLKVLFAEHVKTRNMMKKLDLHHKLAIPSNTDATNGTDSHLPSTGGSEEKGASNRCDRKLYASNQVELGQHPILQYGDLMSNVLEAFLSKMNQHESDRKGVNIILDGVKSKLLEEQHQYRLLSRTNDASMIEIAANKKMIAQYQNKIESLQLHIKTEKEEHGKLNRNLSKTLAVVEEQLSIQTEKNLKLQNEVNLLAADSNHKKELEDNKMVLVLQKVANLEISLAEMKEIRHKMELACKESSAEIDALNIVLKKKETEYRSLRRSSYQYAERAGEEHKKFVQKIDILETTAKQYRQQIKSLQNLNTTLRGQRVPHPSRSVPRLTLTKQLDYHSSDSKEDSYSHQYQASPSHLMHTNPYSRSMDMDLISTPNHLELNLNSNSSGNGDGNVLEKRNSDDHDGGVLNHSSSTASTIVPAVDNDRSVPIVIE